MIARLIAVWPVKCGGSRMKLCSSASVLCALIVLFRIDSAQSADAPSTNAPTVLPTITVTATNETPSLTSPSIQAATEQNLEVPGGFTIRDSSQLERNRGSSFQDLLGGVPGVNVQSQNGME